jgi:hypothetical protein
MLRRLRYTRFGQVVLGIAGVLAITGSFGLHPEPASGATARRGTPLPGWSEGSAISERSHGCPACLAHRTAPIARLIVALVAPAAPVREGDTAPVAPLHASPPLPHDGRAPPRRA